MDRESYMGQMGQFLRFAIWVMRNMRFDESVSPGIFCECVI